MSTVRPMKILGFPFKGRLRKKTLRYLHQDAHPAKVWMVNKVCMDRPIEPNQAETSSPPDGSSNKTPLGGAVNQSLPKQHTFHIPKRNTVSDVSGDIFFHMSCAHFFSAKTIVAKDLRSSYSLPVWVQVCFDPLVKDSFCAGTVLGQAWGFLSKTVWSWYNAFISNNSVWTLVWHNKKSWFPMTNTHMLDNYMLMSVVGRPPIKNSSSIIFFFRKAPLSNERGQNNGQAKVNDQHHLRHRW